MHKRPQIKIKATTSDKIIEGICLAFLIFLWVGVLILYPNLSDQIPIHFNEAGVADRYGDKSNLFLLLGIATLLYLGITILNRHPHIYNYPVKVTEENAEKVYRSGVRLFRMLKLSIVVIFGLIILITYKEAYYNETNLNVWLLPVVVALLTAPTILFMMKLAKRD